MSSDKAISQVRNEDASNLVYSFFEVEPFGAALKETGFTQTERVKHIVDLIRTGEDATKLNALKEFRTVANEVLTVNGLIVDANQQTREGDTTQTLSARKLTKRLSDKNQEKSSGEGTVLDGSQSFLPSTPEQPSLDPSGPPRSDAAAPREADHRRDDGGPQRLD